jgi:hypothetical protein
VHLDPEEKQQTAQITVYTDSLRHASSIGKTRNEQLVGNSHGRESAIWEAYNNLYIMGVIPELDLRK